jgi:hypothetical protein
MTELFADEKCWWFKDHYPDEFEAYGCGPGGIGDFLVPDTVYGLSIRDACRVHDWGYRHCQINSEEDRKRHDRILKNNSLRIVDDHTEWRWVRWLRYQRVEKYYVMVRAFGSRAYWSERNKDAEMQKV